MEISIVIPVYNAEKYLEKCIESVLESLKKTSGEILLIDNGSEDGSEKVIQSYQKKYPTIVKLLHCKVPGAAAVRNYGVKKAKGKYLWFIDADDYIASEAISKLITVASNTKADLVMMGAKRIDRGANSSYLSAVDMNDPNYRSRFVRYGMGPWQVLIRRSWWLKHKFKFMEKFIHEDMELMSSLILYTDRYASVNEPLYFYCQNNDSVLHKNQFSPHIFDIFPALKGLYQKFKTTGAETEYHDELEWFFIWNLLMDSAKDFARFPEGRPGFKRSRKMLKEYFPEWRHNRFLRQKPLKQRILVRLNYYR